MNFVTFISAEFDSLKRRIPKILRYGNRDVQTAFEIAPYAIDSNPIKGMIALYGKTGENGKTFIIGYVNKEQLAQPGENRIYSTDANGELKAYVWLKNNGDILIGGDDYNLSRHQILEQGFNQLRDDFNDLVGKWNAFASTYSPGSPSSVGTPPTAQEADPSDADISGAKINEIKTI